MKQRALVIVAHNDDEVLGCGGFIKQLRDKGWEVGILIMVKGTEQRGETPHFGKLYEQSYNASVHLGAGPTESHQSFGNWGVIKENYRDQMLDCYPEIEITKSISKYVEEFKPIMVLTHFEHDLNKDHEIVSKCVKVACRTTKYSSVDWLYEFPVLSSSNYNSVNFQGDTYIELSENDIKAKVSAMKCYKDEYGGLRTEENIITNAKYLGMDIGVQYAEILKTVRCRISFKS